MTDNIVSTPKYVAFVIAFAVLAALLMTDDDGFLPIIGYANVVFHEAGHFIFAVFGDSMGLYGGTLGQLLPPMAAAVYFWRRRSLTSVSVALLWFFMNFFDIAEYIASSRREGPKVYGVLGWGFHDWWAILTRWGLLRHDTTVATIVRAMGWLGLLATLVFMTLLWRSSRKYNARQ